MYIEHLHIPVGPGTMHVERLGRGGPVVLLLHGFAQSAFLWRAVAPALAADGFTVLAPDLLGFGESDRRADLATAPGAQAEALERVLTALRLGEVSLVGQDLGGLVGLLLAAEHPRRCRRLALIEPLDPADLPGPAIRTLQRTSALAALGSNGLFGARPVLEPFLRGAVADPERMPDRLVARYLAPFVGPDGMRDLLQLASGIQLSREQFESLGDVTGEVQLWLGEAPDAGLARWQAILGRASVSLHEPAAPSGLLVAESSPDALLTAIRSWLA